VLYVRFHNKYKYTKRYDTILEFWYSAAAAAVRNSFRLMTNSVAMTTSQIGSKSHIVTYRCSGPDCAPTSPSRLHPRLSATGNVVSASRPRGTPTSATPLRMSASFRSRTYVRSCTPSIRTIIITSTRKSLSPRSTVRSLLFWINSRYQPFSRYWFLQPQWVDELAVW